MYPHSNKMAGRVLNHGFVEITIEIEKKIILK